MRFQVLAFIMAMATTSLADMHHNGICYNQVGDAMVYNADATAAACSQYNPGGDAGICSDCVLVAHEGSYSYCQSNGENIDGDQITGYCTRNGATSAITS